MFRRFTVLSAILTLLAGAISAQTWNFDKAHSSIGFSVRHMVISKTKGFFNDYSGQVVFDGKDMSSGIYICRMDIDGRSYNRRMLLLK